MEVSLSTAQSQGSGESSSPFEQRDDDTDDEDNADDDNNEEDWRNDLGVISPLLPSYDSIGDNANFWLG